MKLLLAKGKEGQLPSWEPPRDGVDVKKKTYYLSSDMVQVNKQLERGSGGKEKASVVKNGGCVGRIRREVESAVRCRAWRSRTRSTHRKPFGLSPLFQWHGHSSNKGRIAHPCTT